jgi:hypothetical protein
MFIESSAHIASYRLPGLLPSHRRPADCIFVRRNVLDPESDDVASPQLAVDGQIEHRQVAGSSLDLQLAANGPDVFGPERRLRPDQLALFQGMRRIAARVGFS